MKKVIGMLCVGALIAMVVLFLRRGRGVENPQVENPDVQKVEKPAIRKNKAIEFGEKVKDDISRGNGDSVDEEFCAFIKRYEGMSDVDSRVGIKGITTVEGKVDKLVRLLYWTNNSIPCLDAVTYCRIVREIGLEAIPYLMKYLMKKDGSEGDERVKSRIGDYWLKSSLMRMHAWEDVRAFIEQLPITVKEKAEWSLCLDKWGDMGFATSIDYAPYMLEHMSDPDQRTSLEVASLFLVREHDSPEVAYQRKAWVRNNIDKFERLLMERDMGEWLLAGIAEEPAVKMIYARYLERPAAHGDLESEQRNMTIVKLLKEVYRTDPTSINIILKAFHSVPEELKKKDNIEEQYRMILASLGHEGSFHLVLQQIDGDIRSMSGRLSYLAETKDPRLVPYAMKWLFSLGPVKEAWRARDIMQELTNITGFGVEFRYSMIACGDEPGTCDHHAHISKYYRQWMEWWEKNRGKHEK